MLFSTLENLSVYGFDCTLNPEKHVNGLALIERHFCFICGLVLSSEICVFRSQSVIYL